MITAKNVYKRLQTGSVLIVHSKRQTSASLRTTVRGFGAPKVLCCKTYSEALARIEGSNLPYIFFETSTNSAQAIDFAKEALKLSPDSILVSLVDPAILDTVFDMLALGVRGFLVMPCNPSTIEETLISATSGFNVPPELKASIQHSSDKKDAFASLIVRHVDLLSRALKTVGFDNLTASPLATSYQSSFRESVRVARRFFTGDPHELREAIVTACIKSAQNGARTKTRLGKVRTQLARKREVKRLTKS